MKIVTVIDGDTYMAVDKKGKRRKLRLYGIDCPEMHQSTGALVQQEVKALVGKKWVKVRLKGRDPHRRFLCDLRCDQGDLANYLVKHGLAYPLKNFRGFKLSYWSARIQGRGIHRYRFSEKPWHARNRGGFLRSLRHWVRPRKKRR